MAELLGISLSTVKYHISQINEKCMVELDPRMDFWHMAAILADSRRRSKDLKAATAHHPKAASEAA